MIQKSEMKFCKDCKHCNIVRFFYPSGSVYDMYCNRPVLSLVTGNSYSLDCFAQKERETGGCGVEARFYKERTEEQYTKDKKREE